MKIATRSEDQDQDALLGRVADEYADRLARNERPSVEDWDWFFLAMAHGRLGHVGESRRWFDQAVAFLDQQQPPPADLVSIRTEAAQVLGKELSP